MAAGGGVEPILARELGEIFHEELSMEAVVSAEGVRRMYSPVSEQSARWSCAPVSIERGASEVVMEGWASRRVRKVGRVWGLRASWMGGGEVTF